MSHKLASCFQEGQEQLLATGKQTSQEDAPPPGGEGPHPLLFLLSSWLWNIRTSQVLQHLLLRAVSNINSVLHGPGRGSAYHSEGRERCQLPTETSVVFQLRKLCWQGTVQEDFVVVTKKLKSPLQKNGQSYWDSTIPPCLLREGKQSPSWALGHFHQGLRAMWKSLSRVRLLWPHGLYSPRSSPGQNTGVGSLSLLQGIFPSQGSNQSLPHCKQILYQLSHKGSPRILVWVAFPFSRGSSRPRNRTGVSCTAGGFFTSWATREPSPRKDVILPSWSSIASHWSRSTSTITG